MGARDKAPSLSLSKRDAAERHNRVLLHALQIAHPVIYQGRNRFIQCLNFQTSGGGIDVDVYLTGSPERIAPEDISLAAEIT